MFFGSESVQVFLLFVYICIDYGGVGWDLINWFNPTTFLCLSLDF